MASNCLSGGAKERTEYVKELMNHIHVDSYGECLHNKDHHVANHFQVHPPPPPQNSPPIMFFVNYKPIDVKWGKDEIEDRDTKLLQILFSIRK